MNEDKKQQFKTIDVTLRQEMSFIPPTQEKDEGETKNETQPTSEAPKTEAPKQTEGFTVSEEFHKLFKDNERSFLTTNQSPNKEDYFIVKITKEEILYLEEGSLNKKETIYKFDSGEISKNKTPIEDPLEIEKFFKKLIKISTAIAENKLKLFEES
ncbi:hypothetical protein DID80_00630 [Candidatus Marinamargulisbacteria bacterium SCGC AAA071-K20]|nr:hypothetical protein DID80_00630 [Candidatus Marinamargulisbacteria bacterium SCGC AAA071-K20]